MFTGIMREIGTITRVRRGTPWRMTVRALRTAAAANRGDSIAVSGVCLTVVDRTDTEFEVEISAETIRRTAFQSVRSGVRVNLEPALRMDSLLDGHIVQGHVDGTGRIIQVTGRTEKVYRIRPDTDPGPLIVEKGSVALDGISLTVADLLPGNEFTVAVIPLTLADTTFADRRAGDILNIEYDILGKYVGRWVGAR